MNPFFPVQDPGSSSCAAALIIQNRTSCPFQSACCVRSRIKVQNQSLIIPNVDLAPELHPYIFSFCLLFFFVLFPIVMILRIGYFFMYSNQGLPILDLDSLIFSKQSYQKSSTTRWWLLIWSRVLYPRIRRDAEGASSHQ